MDEKVKMDERVKLEGKCPFGGDRIGGATGSGMALEDWWPNRLQVELLHQDPPEADPLDPEFDYAEAFSKLDFNALKQDIKELLTSSQPWWPSDFGNYGPQMIRMAWHAAGTYRIADGRGGAGQALQRFAPINSWEDNGNIDKSRRLLWPIKKKYGKSLSWGDLMMLTGNCALELMGFKTFGFGGGRLDAWEADRATYWGPETEMLGRDRWEGEPTDEHYDLENPMGNSQFGLIYVNPEGPAGNNIPEQSAREIRQTFGRMAMNDEETAALIAGGHAFGKSHGAVDPANVGPAPEAAPMEAQGLGWMNAAGTGFAEYTMTNGIEGAWTPRPTHWDNDYLTNLFKYEWEQTTAPSGATQWKPTDDSAPKAPDAHKPGVEHPLMMMTSDIALKVDPSYRKICEKFIEDFDYFADAFARAWFKLTHRDMGPKTRYLGPEVPEVDLIWQDPTPARDYDLIEGNDITQLKTQILDSGLSVSELAGVAWGAASSHRVSDKRGGADGGRIRLAPMKDWTVNNPAEIKKVVETMEGIKADFDGAQSGNKKVSIADLIVLGGCAAVEKAARDAGIDTTVPFTPGRTDASEEQIDEQSFEWLRPMSDGFRNFHDDTVRYQVAPEQIFMDRADLLGLSAPEWAVLTGGLRVLDINTGGSKHGVFTDRPGVLTNDFFTNLTTMDYYWHKTDEDGMSFELRRRDNDAQAFTATRCDLVFGANSQLRQISEVYASDDGQEKMVRDFVKAWDKVMMLDRYDVAA